MLARGPRPCLRQAYSPAGRGAAEIVGLDSLHVWSLVLLVRRCLLAVRISAASHGSCERIHYEGSTAGGKAVTGVLSGGGSGRAGMAEGAPASCSQNAAGRPCCKPATLAPLPGCRHSGGLVQRPGCCPASANALLAVSKQAARPGRKGWRGRNSICVWWLEGAVHSQSWTGKSIGARNMRPRLPKLKCS